MRIIDWSSDVCSSDLAGDDVFEGQPAMLDGLRLAVPTTLALDGMDPHVSQSFAAALSRLSAAGARIEEIEVPEFAQLAAINAKGGFTSSEAWAWHRDLIARAARSEEHTSELQSLMRSSYAVFCLKKKKR